MDTINIDTDLFKGDVIINNITYATDYGNGTYSAVLAGGKTIPLTEEQYSKIIAGGGGGGTSFDTVVTVLSSMFSNVSADNTFWTDGSVSLYYDCGTVDIMGYVPDTEYRFDGTDATKPYAFTCLPQSGFKAGDKVGFTLTAGTATTVVYVDADGNWQSAAINAGKTVVMRCVGNGDTYQLFEVSE